MDKLKRPLISAALLVGIMISPSLYVLAADYISTTSKVTTWVANETKATASRLNAEFDNLYTNDNALDTNLTVSHDASGYQEFIKGSDIASAAALTLGSDGNAFDVTGTTNITSIASKGAGFYALLQFDGVLTLIHNATDLVLPNGSNIITAAGDIGVFHEYSAGDWRLVSFSRSEAIPNYDSTFTIVDESDLTKRIKFDVGSAATGTTFTFITTQESTISVWLPDVEDSLMARSSTDTMTNKTFDANGTGNSISNIDVEDLAAFDTGALISSSGSTPQFLYPGNSGYPLLSRGAGTILEFGLISQQAFTTDTVSTGKVLTTQGTSVPSYDFIGLSSLTTDGSTSRVLMTNGVSDASWTFMSVADLSARGTSGQVLTSNGTGSAATFQDLSVAFIASIVDSTDSPYSASWGEVVLANLNQGDLEVDMPTAVGNTGKSIHVKVITINDGTAGDGAAYTLTIDPNGAETIDTLSAEQLRILRESYLIISDGSNLQIL